MFLGRAQPRGATPEPQPSPTAHHLHPCQGGSHFSSKHALSPRACAVHPLPPQVLWNAKLGYALAVLADGATRSQLEGIAPQRSALLEASPPALVASGGLRGVIVSAAGVYACVLFWRGWGVCQAAHPHAKGNTFTPTRATPLRPSGPAGGPHKFLSRFFGPWVGVDEDPVTGSAHCLLGPYWAARLGGLTAGSPEEGGKEMMLARQCSARGGDLRVELLPGAVRVSGQAAVVLRGELLL